jgi:transitional endoplasmic reticulum ATPase
MVDFPEDVCPIIAKLSEGFSFAYLKELFVIALLVIARGGKIEEVEDQAQIEDTKSQTSSEPIMVEHEPAVEIGDGVDKATTGVAGDDTKKSKEAPKKRVVPEVETPPHLQDNTLLKVVRAQLKILLEEMDNTKEEDWPSEKTPSSGNHRMAIFHPPPPEDD